MKKNLLLILNGVLLAILVSCKGKSVNEIPAGSPILIDTKAQIKSKGKTNNVKIEIALDRGKAIRLEVTATLGYRVATVVMTPQGISYALHTSQTFVHGPFAAKTLYPIFNENIDPRILWKVIHDQNPQAVNLSCQADAAGRPLSCEGAQNLTVKWTYQDPPQKRIDLKNNQFEMAWLFKDQSILTVSQSDPNSTFVLKKPEAYKEIFLK